MSGVDTKEEDVLAEDRFEAYFAEKLWAWIPELYRQLDGAGPAAGPLRSLVEVLASQSAIARRSIDRLWEDVFIDSCDEWAVPYLGELVGTRLLSELNLRGRRADVANTIYYRRRKGTPFVLERLVRDITGWEVVLVEGYRTLARTRHRLDAEMTGAVARGEGGTRSIRDMSAHAIGEPFALGAHTPDMRRLRGGLGRYNITKLNFHLFRQRAMALRGVTPKDLGGGRFTLDPSGRDVALFQRSLRDVSESRWKPPAPWELPRALSCSLLGSYRLELSLDVLGALREAGADGAAVDRLLPFVGRSFSSLSRLDQFLARIDGAASLRDFMSSFVAFAQRDDSPHRHLVWPGASLWLRVVGDSAGPEPRDIALRSASIAAADLSAWESGLVLFAGQAAAVDPARGRLFMAAGQGLDEVALHHIGAFGEVGAGTYDRRAQLLADVPELEGSGGTPPPGAIAFPSAGAFEIRDSRSYEVSAAVADVEGLTVQARNHQRPYLFRAGAPGAAWGFHGQAAGSVLVLDGLWLGAQFAADTEDTDGTAEGTPAPLILTGSFDRVVLRHCTIDPGGTREIRDAEQSEASVDLGAISPVIIEVRGAVRELYIDRSIVGSIVTRGDGSIETLNIRDSIVQQAPGTSSPAVDASMSELHIERSTVFGDVRVSRLYASELIAAGVIAVTDNQHGCFRFSTTGREGDLPQQFESHRFAAGIEPHFFVSQRFGDGGYGQLSRSSPPQIASGAETRSEMGVFSRQLGPIKVADLHTKVREYMPFGLVPQFIFER